MLTDIKGELTNWQIAFDETDRKEMKERDQWIPEKEKGWW